MMTRALIVLLQAGMTLTLPAAALSQRSTGSTSSSDPAHVSDVTVAGVTVYNPAELVASANDRRRNVIAPATLETIADAIESIYREDGFALAEAAVVLDPSGRRFILVDEGSIESISLDGLKPRLARSVSRILAPVMRERPLHRATLERSLALASDLAGVQVHAHATPGDVGTILNVDATVRSHAGVAGVEVIPARPGLAVRAYVSQEFYGLAVPGDLLRVTALLSRDARESPSGAALATYRAPISSAGTYVEFYGGNVIGRRTFRDNQTTYRLRGVTAGALLGIITRRNLQNFAYLVAEGEYQRARSRVSSAVTESEALSARLHWTGGHDYERGGILRWGVTVSAGFRPDDDRPTFTEGPRKFAHLRGEFGTVRVISKDSNSTIRIDARGQFTRTTLPEVERFSIGHAPFLRGYAPGEIEGDSGLSGTLEFARSFENVRLGQIKTVAPFAFASAGAAWLDQPRRPLGERRTRQIASAGVGADFRTALWQLSGWVAVPLANGPRSDAGNPAVYLSITRGW